MHGGGEEGIDKIALGAEELVGKASDESHVNTSYFFPDYLSLSLVSSPILYYRGRVELYLWQR